MLADPDLPGPEADEVRAALRAVDATRADLERIGWRFLSADEGDFPSRLAAASDPPLGVFVRGTLPQGHAVALVGARRATAYGRAGPAPQTATVAPPPAWAPR